MKYTSVRQSGRKCLSGLTICIAMIAGMASFSGCHRQVAAGQTTDNSSPDPADANLAPVDGSQQQGVAPATVPGQNNGQSVQNESQQRADEYRRTGTQAGAPVDQQNAQQNDQQNAQQNEQQGAQQNEPQNQSYASDQNDPNNPNNNDQTYDDQVDAGQQAIEEADQPPPALPVYVQPVAPDPNYIWTPGYWNYAPLGYYWVPGAWVAAPYTGALWTPGYWGFYGNRYRFYRGYWGLHIGFYGGIPYGCGYTGYGYQGGYWRGNNFYYNRAVNRINPTRITNVYNRTVIANNNTRVSYDGGRGGLQVRPRPAELVAMRGPKIPPMTAQLQNQRQAAQNRQQFFNQNRGRPAMAAVARPLVADRGIQRPVARPMPVTGPQVRTGQPNQIRPGQNMQPDRQQVRPNQPQIRPGQPQVRPDQAQIRPVNPQQRPDQPQTRPVQPQVRPGQPQIRPVRPEVRPAQPQERQNQLQTRPVQPQIRPTQPQIRPVQPEVRSAQPQERQNQLQTRPVQPQIRPTQPQIRPVQPQIRPMQPQAQPMQPQRQAQPQFRPEARPIQPRPEPQPQFRSAPEPRPQPQARPAEAPRPQSQPQPREAPRNEQRR